MDKIVFRGKLFEVIEREKISRIKVAQIDEEKTLKYELVRRAPGVRAIVIQDRKVLLNHEYRYELDKWDYRLPGGKVFDTLDDYLLSLENESVQNHIEMKLCEEMKEEAEIENISYKFLEVSHCGLTVEWDLYYFLVDEFTKLPSHDKNQVKKSEYEFIEHDWMDFSSAYKLCLNGGVSEARSALVLLNYLSKKR